MEDPESRLAAARSARTFVGLFAAIGALGLLVTGWWITRDSADSLSAATPPAVVGKAVEKLGGKAVEKPGEKPSARPVAAPVAAAPASDPQGLSLTIEARKTSWIRVQIDGKDEVGRTYQVGETRHIEGAHAVAVRAGDAGAVFVSVDGSTPQPIGASGNPATKQYSKASATTANPAVAVGPSDASAATARTGASAILTSAPVPAPAAQAAAAKRTDARGGPQSAVASVPPGAGGAVTTAGDPTPASADTPGGRPDLVQAGQQWLDAYQRRDRDAMASSGTENITVSDERSVTERFPAWQGNVRRDLDQVELELTGDTALLTARMTEHTDGAQSGQHISRVSQIWVRRSGRWRLADVRIIGEARLNQIVR
jgi:ketosteroid isomerase-like protein